MSPHLGLVCAAALLLVGSALSAADILTAADQGKLRRSMPASVSANRVRDACQFAQECPFTVLDEAYINQICIYEETCYFSNVWSGTFRMASQYVEGL